MICEWCASPGARPVSVHPAVVVRCNEPSPWNPAARCRKPKGHLDECRADAPQPVTLLCARCWGVWNETGERPVPFRMRSPLLNGRAVDLRTLR